MNHPDINPYQAQGCKKRMVMTSELEGKFKCKNDFLKYFRDACKCPPPPVTLCVVQLYLPAKTMVNKDFLKAVLSGEKHLLELKQVKFINVPVYDELAVKHMYPLARDEPRLLLYFPDRLPKGRLPDRDYFWNVFNTLNEEYVGRLIKHAHEQRNSAGRETEPAQNVVVTEDWWQKLTAVPFISCKYPLPAADVFVAENPGRTLHLLKAKSKPVPQARKRRKIALAGTPAEFREYMESIQSQEPSQLGEPSQRPSMAEAPGRQPADKSGGGPNIIGNKEDQPPDNESSAALLLPPYQAHGGLSTP